MRNLQGPQEHRITSLTELDALVGEFVMQEEPTVLWEDAAARYRFDSLDEALDVLHDPVLQDFLSSERCNSPVLKVCEFRSYSTAMDAALAIVERLAPAPLHLHKDGREWVASFGACAAIEGDSAPIAICLAALRSTGREVWLDLPVVRGRSV